jgi:N-acetylglucosamine-6-phosphate deacetylase
MNSESGEISARHWKTGEWTRLSWSHGKIAALETQRAPGKEEVWLAPALSDAQVNGFAGIDFQQDNLTAHDLETAARGLQTAGCTRFLLTLITDEWPRLLKRLQHLRALRESSATLRHALAGWHVEGPFLSSEPGFHGAHEPAFMRDPTPADIRELRNITGNDPVLLTIAPERQGAIEAIELAVSVGMKVSLGHTNAPLSLLRDAVSAGATMFTHLANGCPRELDRHDNIIWRVLETEGLTVSLIPDEIHVSGPLFRFLHRLLPEEKIFYVSDAMSAAGMKPGRFPLGKLTLEVGSDEVVRQPGKALFAGSALRPIQGVFRAAAMLNEPWQKAWARFSEKPASLSGSDASLMIGAAADFCVVEINGGGLLQKCATYSEGQFYTDSAGA